MSTDRYVARCWVECPPEVALDPAVLDFTVASVMRGARLVWNEDPDTVGRVAGPFGLSVDRIGSLLTPDIVLIRAELPEVLPSDA